MLWSDRMSFFSDLIKGKKRVQTWTTTSMILQEIVESDVLEETRQRLVLKYVQTGYGARDYCLDYGNTGAAQFFQYYLGGHYDYSDVIPTVTLGGVGTPLHLLQQILDDKYGQPVSILEYYAMSPAYTRSLIIDGFSIYNVYGGNLDTIIKGYLSSQYDYDFLTNTLYHTNGYTYEYIHWDIDTLNGVTSASWSGSTLNGTYISSVAMRQKGTNNYIRLPTNINNTVHSSDTNSDTTGFALYWAYIFVPYYYTVYIDPITGRSKLWMYPPLINAAYWDTRYPELDLYSYNERDEIGYAKQYNSFESYPIVTVRENRIDVQSLKDGSTTQQKRYKETVAMLNNLGIPLDTITEAYLDSSIDNVQVSGATTVDTVLKDVFIQLGVSPAHNESVVSQCLFDFFDKIYAELPNSLNSIFYPYTLEILEGNLNTYYEWVPRLKVIEPSVGRYIGEYWHTCQQLPASARTETMQVKVGASYLNLWVDPGIAQATSVIMLPIFLMDANPPGLYYLVNLRNGSGQGTRYQITFDGITYTFNPTEVNNFINASKVSGNGRTTVARTNTGVLNATLTASVDEMYRLSIYKQISETEAEVIHVDNLRSWNGVLAGQTKVENLLMKDGVANSHFLIPLSVKLIDNMTFMERTDLLSHCVHMTLYIYSQYKLEYREGGILGKLLQVLSIIVTVVISIIAPPAGAAMAGSLSAISATAISNILSNLFTNFLIGMALSIALKVIMKMSGSTSLKMILSAITMAAAVYIGGGFDGALDSLSNGLKTAVDLAEIPLKVIDMYVNTKLQETMEAMNALQSEASAFYDSYNEIYAQYSEILNSLNAGISTEYLVGLQRMGSTSNGTGIATPWVMSPSALYNAMLQGQYNYNSLYANGIEDYVTNALRLGVIDA